MKLKKQKVIECKMSISNKYSVDERNIMNTIYPLKRRIVKSRLNIEFCKKDVNILIDEFNNIQQIKEPEKRIVLNVKKYKLK